MSINTAIDGMSIDDLKRLVIDMNDKLHCKDRAMESLYRRMTEIRKTITYLMEKDDLVYNSKKELEMIFDASDDYIVILDKKHVIRRANILFCNLFNKAPKDVIGTKLSSYFIDIDLENIDITGNKFFETIFYSKSFDKTFLVKSRKLHESFEPLVYLHITSEIIGKDEC